MGRDGIEGHGLFARPLRSALVMACTFAAVLLVCLCALVAAFSLPSAPVRDSALRSIPLLQEEGVYPRVFEIENFRLDNWTDATMLGVAVAATDGSALASAMLASQPAGNDPITALESFLAQEPVETPDYSRYWHGYQVLLRPALALGLDYGQIRAVNAVAQVALLALSIAALVKARLGRLVPALLATALSISAAVFPLSLQYSSVYCTALLALSLALLLRRCLHTLLSRCAFMLAVGMVTNFVDFLTFPLLTLGFPLVAMVMLDGTQPKGGHFGPARDASPIVLVIALSTSWACGYALMWASKWMIASAVLGGNYITPALQQAAMRSSHELNPNAGTGLSSFTVAELAGEIASYWASPVAFVPFLLCVLGYGFARMARPCEGFNVVRVAALALVALIPVAWFLVLGNHSFQHAWFAFRTAAVCEFALLAMISPRKKEAAS